MFCIYIPPNLNANNLNIVKDSLSDEIDKLWIRKPHFQFVITGDFNQFNVHELCIDQGFKDVIKQPTRGNHILDHILVSEGLHHAYCAGKVTYCSPIGNSDHKTLFLPPSICHSNSSPNVSRLHKVYDFRRSNIDNLLFQASLVDWDAMLKGLEDVDVMWFEFHKTLIALLQQWVPYRLIPITKNDKDWMTPLTKKLILDKWAAYHSKEWSRYNHLKLKVKAEVLKSKKLWAERLMKTTNGLWKLVKQHRHGQKGGFSSLGSDDLLLKEFSSDLTDFFSQPTSSMNFDSDSLKEDDWCLNVSEFTVWQKLSRYPKKKASGADDIPTRIYVELAYIIAKPLTTIFNQSCRMRQFPDAWKKGLIIPIPKTSPPDIKKVRYITLLPLPSKLLEALILDNLRSKFESCYGDDQHGFRKGASIYDHCSTPFNRHRNKNIR